MNPAVALHVDKATELLSPPSSQFGLPVLGGEGDLHMIDLMGWPYEFATFLCLVLVGLPIRFFHPKWLGWTCEPSFLEKCSSTTLGGESWELTSRHLRVVMVEKPQSRQWTNGLQQWIEWGRSLFFNKRKTEREEWWSLFSSEHQNWVVSVFARQQELRPEKREEMAEGEREESSPPTMVCRFEWTFLLGQQPFFLPDLEEREHMKPAEMVSSPHSPQECFILPLCSLKSFVLAEIDHP